MNAQPHSVQQQVSPIIGQCGRMKWRSAHSRSRVNRDTPGALTGCSVNSAPPLSCPPRQFATNLCELLWVMLIRLTPQALTGWGAISHRPQLIVDFRAALESTG